MQKITFFLLATFFLQTNLSANAFDLIVQRRVATSLNKVTLFADSAFTQPTNTVFDEGELFEIIGETTMEHEDKDQNQRFKWLKVRAKNKLIGWIFGDGLAVLTKEKLTSNLQNFQQKKYQFDNGFEQAMTWIGKVEGTESKPTFNRASPYYAETYLVITNENGASVFINISGESVTGKQQLREIQLLDITGDKIKDIFLEKSAFSAGSLLENRTIELYHFSAGSLRKIFEQYTSLSDGDDTPSPALFKAVECHDEMIRVSFVDFLRCENYQQPYTFDQLTQSQERCVEYSTSTFAWDDTKKQFVSVYPESRTALLAYAKNEYVMRQSPTDSSAVVANTFADEELTLIKSYESFSQKNGETTLQIWLYCQNKQGKLGYLPAFTCYFGDIEHGTILHDYFNHPPNNRLDWSSKENLLFFSTAEK